MARPIAVEATSEQLGRLERLYRTEKNGGMCLRMGIVFARTRGIPVSQMAATFGVCRKTVAETVKRFNVTDSVRLRDQPQSGRSWWVPYDAIKTLLSSTPRELDLSPAQGQFTCNERIEN